MSTSLRTGLSVERMGGNLDRARLDINLLKVWTVQHFTELLALKGGI